MRVLIVMRLLLFAFFTTPNASYYYSPYHQPPPPTQCQRAAMRTTHAAMKTLPAVTQPPAAIQIPPAAMALNQEASYHSVGFLLLSLSRLKYTNTPLFSGDGHDPDSRPCWLASNYSTPEDVGMCIPPKFSVPSDSSNSIESACGYCQSPNGVEASNRAGVSFPSGRQPA